MMTPKQALLIGHPLGHSLSPAFHNAAFRAAGIDATYHLADVLPENLAATVTALRAADVYGANVTVPYKQDVLPFLDALSDEAAALGAVNTIVNDDGRLTGLNTDVPGFAADMRAQGIAVAGRPVILLGAGGAARAVAAALIGMEVGQLVIANRTPERAAAMQRQYPVIANATGIADRDLTDVLPTIALLINATSAGLHGDEIPIAAELLNLLPPSAVVYDLIYRPTALLRAAQERNLRAVDGLGMLIHQGALAWEAWTGRTAPLDVMWQAVQHGKNT